MGSLFRFANGLFILYLCIVIRETDPTLLLNLKSLYNYA